MKHQSPKSRASGVPKDIDAYIATFPREVARVLARVRRAIREAAPEAQEVISYRMPAFKQGGILAYFAGWQSHIGLYPPVRGDAALEKAAAPYAGPKGNLQFPLDQPIPYDLIQRIVRFRVASQSGKARVRSKAGGAQRAATKGRVPRRRGGRDR